jgi:hypothetical protein
MSSILHFISKSLFATVSFNSVTGINDRLPKDLPEDVVSILDKFKGASSPTLRILDV